MNDIKRNKGKVLAIALVSVILVFAASSMFSTALGGTEWQFDYAFTSMDLTPEGSTTITYENTGTPGLWEVDPDGEPAWDPPGSTNLIGIHSGVITSCSLAGRVTWDGMDLPYDAWDPTSLTYEQEYVGDDGEIYTQLMFLKNNTI